MYKSTCAKKLSKLILVFVYFAEYEQLEMNIKEYSKG